MRRASNRRPGWALVWVILTIAIVAALFATAAPSLVSLEAAAMLDLLVDHGTGDTVTYNAPVNDTTTIRYRVMSSGSIVNNRC